MPKDKKVKEIVKVEYKEKIIDNSKNLDIYLTAIRKAATGFAEYISRDHELKVINCPGVDFEVRMLAKELVQDNIIDAKKLFNYLKKKSYRKYDNIISEWWKNEND